MLCTAKRIAGCLAIMLSLTACMPQTGPPQEETGASASPAIIEKPTNPPATFRELLAQMINNGEREAQDVKQFNLTYPEIYSTFASVLQNEACIAAECNYNLTFSTTKDEQNNIVTFALKNVSDDFETRFFYTRQAIETFKATVAPQMATIEKVLLAHEYVVSLTSYQNTGDLAHTASGVFYSGQAVCTGYAKALMVLLRELDIPSQIASSAAMNHDWLLVDIDGEWYHTDPTWADTRPTVAGEIEHTFFIRNDTEFENLPSPNHHYGWAENPQHPPPVCTSAQYSNWFVHNVQGRMYYYNSRWVYLYNNSIVISDIEGNNRETLVTGGAFHITQLDGDTLYYSKNGVPASYSLA